VDSVRLAFDQKRVLPQIVRSPRWIAFEAGERRRWDETQPITNHLGSTVNTYTDRYGNTTGWVGGKYISTYSDGSGGTTGTIGNKRISTYGDGYGYTRGTIGRDQVNTYTDRSGFTTGTIGRRRVNCFTDRLRTTKCY
jgi:hypothetical protein